MEAQFKKLSTVLIVFFFITSCGGNNPTKKSLIGKWNCSSWDLMGDHFDYEPGEYYFEFKEDGSFHEHATMKYSNAVNNFTMDVNGQWQIQKEKTGYAIEFKTDGRKWYSKIVDYTGESMKLGGKRDQKALTKEK